MWLEESLFLLVLYKIERETLLTTFQIGLQLPVIDYLHEHTNVDHFQWTLITYMNILLLIISNECWLPTWIYHCRSLPMNVAYLHEHTTVDHCQWMLLTYMNILLYITANECCLPTWTYHCRSLPMNVAYLHEYTTVHHCQWMLLTYMNILL